MWKFISVGNPELKFNLLVGREYTIGRRDADIVIQNDMSISRKHAVIRVIHPDSNLAAVDKIPQLLYKDVSKLGTLFRNERITNADRERSVDSGDVLELGTAGLSQFRCVYEVLIVTTSSLDHNGKRVLKSNVAKLGGHVIGDWTNDCSIVVMSKLQVTLKVICALVSLKRIVIPQYFADVVAAFEAGAKLPDPTDYQPPLTESQVNPSEVSFKPDERRKSLFRGKKFIFFSSAQYHKMQTAIVLAGGITILAENSGVEDADDNTLVDDNTCVMWSEIAATQSSQANLGWLKHVHLLLSKCGRRMITDSEIGFAVLYCSTVRYCNPSVLLDSNFSGALPTQTMSAPMMTSQVSQMPPSGGAQPSTTRVTFSQKRTEAAFAVPANPVVASVQIKQEPLSQTVVKQSCPEQQRVGKRTASDSNSGRPSAKQMRLDKMFSAKAQVKSGSVEPSSSTCDIPCSASIQQSTIDSQPPQRQSSVFDASKVETTFVVDSLATNTDQYADTETDLFDVLPRRKRANKNTSPNVAAAEVKTEINDQLSASVTECRDSQPSSSLSEQEIPTLLVRGCVSVQSSVRPVDEQPTSVERLNTAVVMPSDIPAGFLSTRALNRIAREETVLKEENVPNGITIVEEANLIVSRPARKQLEPINAHYSSVKNFKVFRKNIQCASLPRIIGGRDLVVHDRITPVQQEWFDKSSQADTIRNDNKDSEELFNWQPSRRRKV